MRNIGYSTRVNLHDGEGFHSEWIGGSEVSPSLDVEIMQRTERPWEAMAFVELRVSTGYAMTGATASDLRSMAASLMAAADRLDEANEITPDYLYSRTYAEV